MYLLLAGGGKVGANLARSLLRLGHEVTIVEQDRERYERLEHELEHQVQLGDATELHVLERAGIKRPPDVVAVGSTELQPGDQVLAILQPGKEDELRRVLLKA